MGLRKNNLIRNHTCRELTGLTYLELCALRAVVIHSYLFDGPVTGASVTMLVRNAEGLDGAGNQLVYLFRKGWLRMVGDKHNIRKYYPKIKAIQSVFAWAGASGPGVAAASGVAHDAPLAEVG